MATPSLINTICRCATEIVTEAGRPPVYSTDAMGLTAWLASDDTGLSSKYMASELADPRFSAEFYYPRDGGDFGRCYRLLRAAPELLKNFDRLATCPAPWPALHAGWMKLEELYEASVKHDKEQERLGVRPDWNSPQYRAFSKALGFCIGR